MISETFGDSLAGLPRAAFSGDSSDDFEHVLHRDADAPPLAPPPLPLPVLGGMSVMAIADFFEPLTRGRQPAALPPGPGRELCVVAPTRGDFLPKYGFVSPESVELRMAHYRGYRQSPFVPIPRRLKKAIHAWRDYPPPA
jgi:hypothetical protein